MALSLSSFIDLVFQGESRCRHFKRLETLRRYNVYESCCDLFEIETREQVLSEDPYYHYICRNVHYVKPLEEVTDEYLDRVQERIENLLKIYHMDSK